MTAPTACRCRCHAYGEGASVTCDVGPEQPGGNRSCTPVHGTVDDEPSRLCERCGAFGDLPHGWVEGDCILPHKNHSRKLVAGSQVCQPCVDRWGDWLTEIVDLYATLSDVLLAGSVPDDTAEHKHQRKAPASPSPIRLDAWALLHPEGLNAWVKGDDGVLHPVGMAGLPDVADVLRNWAQAAFDAHGWTMEAPDTVSGAAVACRVDLETIAGLPDCDTFDAELRWVRRALRSAHGISNPSPLGACLNVGCGGMVWPDHGASPRCDRCSRRYGTLDLVRLKVHEKRGEEAS